MANNCYYEMKIVGKKRNCREFFLRLNSESSAKRHFFRMSGSIYDSSFSEDEENENEKGYMCILGECAWSLETCCRASRYSKGVDLFAEFTKELDIEMEAYSSEPGCGFQEHYIYKKGKCITNECLDWQEWDLMQKDEDMSFEQFKKEFGVPENVTEDDFEDDKYSVGGFKNWDFIIEL